MRLPTLQGLIRRRLLVNFRIDPTVVQRQLPQGMRPKLHNGMAIGGVCLIRLERIRPRGLPGIAGVASESAAHRIAVVWDDADGPREGVYIPRRDTGSLLNHLAGGRLFPGEHHRARFQICEDDNSIELRMQSDDGAIRVQLNATVADALPRTSIFGGLQAASAFFEPGSIGYSTSSDPGRLDGVELRTDAWHLEALAVSEVFSSYFADTGRFPTGSASFDCALLMRNIKHQWRSAADMYI